MKQLGIFDDIIVDSFAGGDYTSTCSCCNNDVDVDHKKEPKYCPECGAKMHEEEQK